MVGARVRYRLQLPEVGAAVLGARDKAMSECQSWVQR
jgi:hypothetical protein